MAMQRAPLATACTGRTAAIGSRAILAASSKISKVTDGTPPYCSFGCRQAKDTLAPDCASRRVALSALNGATPGSR